MSVIKLWFNFSNFWHTASFYDKKSKLNLKIRGLHPCFLNSWPLTLPWNYLNFKIYMYLYGKWPYWGLLKWYIIFLQIKNMFLWFNFRNILNVYILNTNTWIAIIIFVGHHASKFGIIYSNGGHIGFNYTHTSLKQNYVCVTPGA